MIKRTAPDERKSRNHDETRTVASSRVSSVIAGESDVIHGQAVSL